MKKIKHLELSPFQKMSREELRHTVAGADVFRYVGTTWDCNCYRYGMTCEEIHEYRRYSSSKARSSFAGEVMTMAEIKKYNVMEIYQKFLFIGSENGAKHHDPLQSGIRFKY